MTTLLECADWSFPIPIKYGPGRLGELGALCRDAGIKRPLLVTDRGSSDLPFIDQAQTALAGHGIVGKLFCEVAPNPTDENISVGREVFRSGDHDGVIAIGGGSGMDAGKSISLVGRNDRCLLDFDYDSEPLELETESLVPLICVPTTAGTGAETESTAMITDTRRGVKICVWHPSQKPLAAILDPELTVGLPKTLTAWTGCDALVHAIEAFSVPDWHPMCDGLALEAIRLIRRYLPTAVDDGDNLEARGAMLVASCLAGVSFIKGLGLVHAMSHMVGAVCDTHHGLTNAVLLPSVLQYNRHALGEKTALMCRAMDLSVEDFDSLYSATVALLEQLEIPHDLASLGVAEEQVAEIARKAVTDISCGTNPVAATVADIERLLGRAIYQAW
jgi:alcohol dehydrogenase class IV